MIRFIHHHIKKTYAALALLSIELLLIVILFAASFVAFLIVADKIFLQNKFEFDQNAFDFLSGLVSPRNNSVMQFITFFGTATFLLPANVLLAAYFAFIQKHKWYSIKIPVIGITSPLLMYGLKNIFERQRPLVPLLHAASGFSFPSGHSLTSMTFYGLIAYIVWERVKNPYVKWPVIAALIIFIHLIGFSRIYLRVHYPSDVMAGFALGLIWLVISLYVLRHIERYTHKKIDPVVEEKKPEPVKSVA
ncbi:MAG TPA: phosphatase PAP2 family protein [Chitinophagales bacterium]|nr:phosphatase PAP2 family protein [Chitinophagales bacterium]